MNFLAENHNYFKTLMNKDWVVDGRTFNLIKLGWSFGYNNRKRSLGVCRHGAKRIELSRPIFDLNHDFNQYDDTIRHEIAHAIDGIIRGTSDHSWEWKRIARQIGCNAERTANVENKPKGKYTLRCPNGHESIAHRKPKRRKSCAKCNPHRFDPSVEFKVIQNY